MYILNSRSADAGEEVCAEAEGCVRPSEPVPGVCGHGYRAASRPRAEALLSRQLERQERIHPLPGGCTVKVGYCDKSLILRALTFQLIDLTS